MNPEPEIVGGVDAVYPEGKSSIVSLEKKRAEMATAWENVVRGIIAISKGKRGAQVKVEDLVIPEPGAGRYLRYAVDNKGNFSLPRIKGRKHPHWKPSACGLKSRMMDLFVEQLHEDIEVEMVDAFSEGRPFEGISPANQMEIFRRVAKQATSEQQLRRKQGRASRHHRQSVSRRINFGTLVPNQDRNNVSYQFRRPGPVTKPHVTIPPSS